MRTAALGLAFAAAALTGCVNSAPLETSVASRDAHPQARLFDASADAQTNFEAALAAAEAKDRLVLAVMGANWCHDSRALAGWTQQPRLRQLIDAHYELVFINVGMPQTKDGHNLDIALRYGIEIEGTPTVLVISPESGLLNADTAKTWRNAASRSEEDIYAELASFTGA